MEESLLNYNQNDSQLPFCHHHCHGIHQSCTGCCWDPFPLLHNDITELLDVRHIAFLHLLLKDASQVLTGFRSGDMLGHSITFTFTFFSKAAVILTVCFVIIMLEN
ncbi:hypothetical protein HF521_001559 [Silurus meridionalis]|uniref:Uncharacterized protein n=1 Tax=Silurus meridionalis TaxID=175797 RepID=A0A8T0B6H4_SILME|nr:hypothetical protein HF521_001559 [Silurus meridionalis]